VLWCRIAPCLHFAVTFQDEKSAGWIWACYCLVSPYDVELLDWCDMIRVLYPISFNKPQQSIKKKECYFPHAYQIVTLLVHVLFCMCIVIPNFSFFLFFVFFMDCKLKVSSKGCQSKLSFCLIYNASHYSMITQFHSNHSFSREYELVLIFSPPRTSICNLHMA